MSKIINRCNISIIFLLDCAAVLTLVSLLFFLINFWNFIPNLPNFKEQKLVKKLNQPIRWLDINPQDQSKEFTQNSISNQIVEPNLRLETKLIIIPDSKIEQFSELLVDKKIRPPMKISPNIYQVESQVSNKAILDILISDNNIVSGTDSDLFLLEDKNIPIIKTQFLIGEEKTQENNPIPNPRDLPALQNILPPREITNPIELAKLKDLPKDKYIGSQWNLIDPKINVNTDKKPIIVAIIDGGVDVSHPDLVDIVARDSNGQILGWNYWDNTPIGLADISSKLDEAYGHGTHIAGTIAASSNQIGILGTCLGTCVIMPLKVFGGLNSSGKISNAVKAINYAVNNGAKIINLSWGSRNFNPILAQSISSAQSKGVVIVAAAGNNSEDNILYPAKLTGVISVGSLDEQGNKSKTTNYGAGISRYEPGVKILSTTIPASNTCTTENKSFDNGLYNYCSGTSMATAVTSGILAKELSEKK